MLLLAIMLNVKLLVDILRLAASRLCIICVISINYLIYHLTRTQSDCSDCTAALRAERLTEVQQQSAAVSGLMCVLLLLRCMNANIHTYHVLLLVVDDMPYT